MGIGGKSADILSEAVQNLEKAGADFIIICTNTIHKVASEIQSKINIPIIHIADATAESLKKDHISKAALLDTKYTMTQDFYKHRLTEKGIEVLILDDQFVEIVNDVIYHELCLGIISPQSKHKYLMIIRDLSAKGAQGVILGYTEIGLLIQQDDTDLHYVDTRPETDVSGD